MRCPSLNLQPAWDNMPLSIKKNRTKGWKIAQSVTCLVDKFVPHSTCQSALHGIECWGNREETLGSLAGQGQNPGGSLASQFSPAGKLQATEGPASKEVTPRIVLWLPRVYTYTHTYQAGALRLSCFTYEEIEVQGPNDLAQGQC